MINSGALVFPNHEKVKLEDDIKYFLLELRKLDIGAVIEKREDMVVAVRIGDRELRSYSKNEYKFILNLEKLGIFPRILKTIDAGLRIFVMIDLTFSLEAHIKNSRRKVKDSCHQVTNIIVSLANMGYHHNDATVSGFRYQLSPSYRVVITNVSDISAQPNSKRLIKSMLKAFYISIGFERPQPDLSKDITKGQSLINLQGFKEAVEYIISMDPELRPYSCEDMQRIINEI